uniref:Uncharacterized protein n=1 Tax=Cacopsylla melanoneura TaxID=428564 RepID=A0A8D9FF83_9HEMI
MSVGYGPSLGINYELYCVGYPWVGSPHSSAETFTPCCYSGVYSIRVHHRTYLQCSLHSLVVYMTLELGMKLFSWSQCTGRNFLQILSLYKPLSCGIHYPATSGLLFTILHSGDYC